MKKIYAFIFLLFSWDAVFSQPPVITVTPTGLDSFYAVLGYQSAAKSYTVQGTNLTGDILVGGGGFPAFDNFEVSLTASPFVPAYIHLTPIAGIVPPTTIYVQMHAVYLGNVNDGIPNITNGAAMKWVGCSGYGLAPEPTMPGSISFGTKTNNSIEVNMNGGSGTGRLLFVKESSAVNVQPFDGHDYYTGSGAYGVALSQVGTGNYAVYGGTGNTVTVTGLTAGKIYYFTAFEYNKQYGAHYPPDPFNYSEEGTVNYLLAGAATGLETTSFALPIVINHIAGHKQGSSHLLNWKVTCVSSPRVTMILQRSGDSRNYSDINSITADAVRCNQPFDYTDVDPLSGMNYYRMKMIDADGAITYSSIVALLNAAKGFDITGIAPNPVVNDQLNLNVASAQPGKMEMRIFDMQGILVNRQMLSVIAGFNSLTVNVANLPVGTYTIRTSMNDDRSKIIRFVKQ